MGYRFKGHMNMLQSGELVPTEYLEGFPARDLTDDDVAGYSKEQRDRLKASVLYEEVRAAPPAKLREGG
jgi:hypothetical protein